MFGADKEGHHPVQAAACGVLAAISHDSFLAPFDVVKQRMIKQFGYNETSATDVLNYVASIFARGDTKGE